MVKLNPAKVPRPLVPLIPTAEKWAADYPDAVYRASSEELEALVHCIDDGTDDDLFGWLTGPEADNPYPSLEYITFTNLIEAIDLATLLLKERQGYEIPEDRKKKEQLISLVKELLRK